MQDKSILPKRQIALRQFNSLNLESVADYYFNIHDESELIGALNYAEKIHQNVVILSGGSNILIPERLNAVVLHIDIAGIEVVQQDVEQVIVQVGAGENWHNFVCYSTHQAWFGLQNLALIPGRVGASPVQNIGAYGVEVGEFINSIRVYDRIQRRFRWLSQTDCNFAYRDSIFKQHPHRFVICNVRFALKKRAALKFDYGDLRRAVGAEMTAENLQKQVILIRKAKLPDPAAYPNVGSFFKNPVIDQSLFEQLITKFPQIPHYPHAQDRVKIAAGWLIDQAGWKGRRLNAVGMFDKQALVLVNYADATLSDVIETYKMVQHDVFEKFNIQLEPEPILFTSNGSIGKHQE